MNEWVRGNQRGVYIQTAIEWDELGGLLAEAPSSDQAVFLAEFVTNLRKLPGPEFQIQWIADAFSWTEEATPEDRAALRWFLSGLLERLDA
jgi:hypothetical protein